MKSGGCGPPLMRQEAPYPVILADLVDRFGYKPGWQVWLADEARGDDNSGLTLTILSDTEDGYHPDQRIRVRHLFIVPAATYNEKSWRQWLFERVLDVERHEAGEFARFLPAADDDTGRELRPWAPLHGPGNDPYFPYVLTTDEEQRTNNRGEIQERT
jgi:hypothetical protein